MRHRGSSADVDGEDKRSRGLRALATSHVMKLTPSPPMTLGNAAAARARLIVWRKSCQHRLDPDPAEHARDTTRRCPSSNGASGLCVRGAAGARSIWW
jgi:hypothetical protein